jgi:hypothetical protein
MSLDEPVLVRIELKNDNFSRIRADYHAICVHLKSSKQIITPWYLKLTTVLTIQNSSSVTISSSFPLNSLTKRVLLADLIQLNALSFGKEQLLTLGRCEIAIQCSDDGCRRVKG